jgi:excisionase family DNA binding protein
MKIPELLSVNDLIDLQIFKESSGLFMGDSSFYRHIHKGRIRGKRIGKKIYVLLGDLLALVPNFQKEAPYITIHTASKILKLSRSTVGIMVGEEKLPSVRLGKTFYISEKFVREYLEKRPYIS